MEPINTPGELLDTIQNHARKYRLDANDSLARNGHMNDNVMRGTDDIDQEVIGALLVDFINYVGAEMGVDYAMYARDLRERRR